MIYLHYINLMTVGSTLPNKTNLHFILEGVSDFMPVL